MHDAVTTIGRELDQLHQRIDSAEKFSDEWEDLLSQLRRRLSEALKLIEILESLERSWAQ